MHRHALKRKQVAECIRAALCAQDHEKSKKMIHVCIRCLKAKQNQKESGSGGQLTGRKVAYLFILPFACCAWDNAIKNG